MSRHLTLGEFKALTRQLVAAFGGTEAVGLELGKTHQRISQMQSPNHPNDLMSFLEINQLEAIIGRAIITGAGARAVEGEEADEVSTAAIEAVTSTATALRLVHDMDADGRRDQAEIRSVQKATQQAAEAAARLADTAAGLKPAS